MKKLLEGIRVVDFGWVWAGPIVTTMLSFMGAEVIKVESENRLDLARKLHPFFEGKVGPNRSGWLNTQAANKLSLALDLRKPEAVEIARRLVSISDIVVENYRPHAMARFGLGYEDLRAIKPDIIMLSSSGFGASGPESQFGGYGMTFTNLSGLASLTGHRDSIGADIGIPYGDPTSGLHSTVAVLAALRHRRKTGGGQYIEVSQLESVCCALGEYFMEYEMNGRVPTRQGNRDEMMAPHDCYPCSGNDNWVSIAVGNEEEWRNLCRTMEREDLLVDPRFADLSARRENQDALGQIIGNWTSHRTREEATTTLQTVGVAAFPCYYAHELLANPHTKERGFFVEVNHPEVGRHPLPGPPWRLSAYPSVIESPAPLLGQHTEYVLREILGLSIDEISDLVAAGALA